MEDYKLGDVFFIPHNTLSKVLLIKNVKSNQNICLISIKNINNNNYHFSSYHIKTYGKRTV